MPLYLTQFSYRDDAWAALLESPERLAGRFVQALEGELGGRVISLSYFFGLGEYDGMLLFEAPDDATATGLLIGTLSSSSHVKTATTTKLLTPEEFTEALRKAPRGGPPGAQRAS